MSDTKEDFSSPEGYTNFVSKLASPLSTVDFKARFATAGLGLGGEAGEIAQVVAHVNASEMLGEPEPVSEKVTKKLIDELGDVVWYVAFAAAQVVRTPLRSLYPESIESFGQMSQKEKVANLNSYYIQLAYRCGLFADTTKKLLFHGKPFTDEQNVKLIAQLQDIMHTVNLIGADVCGVQLQVIIDTNVVKLSERYKSLQFNTAEFMAKEAAAAEEERKRAEQERWEKEEWEKDRFIEKEHGGT